MNVVFLFMKAFINVEIIWFLGSEYATLKYSLLDMIRPYHRNRLNARILKQHAII